MASFTGPSETEPIKRYATIGSSQVVAMAPNATRSILLVYHKSTIPGADRLIHALAGEIAGITGIDTSAVTLDKALALGCATADTVFGLLTTRGGHYASLVDRCKPGHALYARIPPELIARAILGWIDTYNMQCENIILIYIKARRNAGPQKEDINRIENLIEDKGLTAQSIPWVENSPLQTVNVERGICLAPLVVLRGTLTGKLYSAYDASRIIPPLAITGSNLLAAWILSVI